MLVLEKGTELVTVTVDESRTPIAGAKVEVRSLARHEATTDDGGMATFEGLRPGGAWVVAKREGYAPAFQLVQITKGTESLRAELVLRRGAKVEGRVVDSNDEGVEGAQVFAVSTSKLLESAAQSDE